MMSIYGNSVGFILGGFKITSSFLLNIAREVNENVCRQETVTFFCLLLLIMMCSPAGETELLDLNVCFLSSENHKQI